MVEVTAMMGIVSGAMARSDRAVEYVLTDELRITDEDVLGSSEGVNYDQNPPDTHQPG